MVTIFVIFAIYFIVAIPVHLNREKKKHDAAKMEVANEEIEEKSVKSSTSYNIGGEEGSITLSFPKYDTDEYLPETIDMREPFCPNCGVALDKIPERRVRCKECGKNIYAYSIDEGGLRFVKRLTSQEVGEAHYKKIRDEREAFMKLTSSPEYINAELDKIRDQGFTRVQINGSGCDHCMNKIGKVLSLQAARNMIGKTLSKKCECPYFFSPDMSSRDYSKLF